MVDKMDIRVEDTSLEASSLKSQPPSSTAAAATTVSKNGIIQTFDHDSIKYKCCCKLLHVRHGTQIIGFIELLCAAISLIRYLMASASDHYKWFFISELVNFIILLAIIICLYCAIHKQNPYLLLPYLIYESLSLLEYISFIIFSIIALAASDGVIGDWYYSTVEETSNFKDIERHTLIKYIAVATIIFYIISLIIQLWWNYVVYKCFVYLRDYRKFCNS